MPIFKVPIVHKFGIISHSQRVELQKQLADQSHKKEEKTTSKINANPFQVTEEFVQKYNVAGLDEKEKLHFKVEQLLCRSKRRCGLSSLGEGDHVDLPLGWSELAILAQCKGKLQDDCLDVLCVSLNEAPLHEENIPTLFFLAESSLYWLHVDAMKQPYLRTTEIKLFKMGRLVFLRLLFHHFCGHLRAMADLKVRLSSYMDAIRNQKTLYSSYPDVLLDFEVIISAGEHVVGPYVDSNKTSGHVLEHNESVPALAACVYRALSLWRVAAVSKVGMKWAIVSMMEAVPEISESRDWLNGFMTISLLAEAAKVDIQVCKFLQNIACGSKVSASPRNELSAGNFTPVSPPLTRDIHRGSSEQRLDIGTSESKSNIVKTRSDTSNLASAQRSSIQSGTNPVNTRQSCESDQTLLTDQDYTAHATTSGIGSWSWKNAYQYCSVLTDICLFALNSEIQKTAMMGKWGDADVTTFRAGIANPCVESSGLADLLEYSFVSQSKMQLPDKKFDWSWMVRYGALSGLNKIAHSLSGNKEKAGFRSAAWSLMTAMQECAATDERILEALPVSQLEISSSSKPKATSIWTRMAQQLADVYLPSLEYRPPSSKAARKPRSEPTIPKHSVFNPTTHKIKRPTLGEELLIHTAAPKTKTNFDVRTSMNLQRLVSDQWRKEMLEKQQCEEVAKKDKLLQQRKEEDENEKRMLEKRKEKLKGKPSAMLGPYQILR